MKDSAAILKGFEMVGGKQCQDRYYEGDPAKPAAVCVLGARNLALYGHPDDGDGQYGFRDEFEAAWGIDPQELNDGGMEWEHIYGMAVAVGL